MIEKIKKLFFKEEQKENPGVYVNQEIGYDNSIVLSPGDFPKYDPDLLKQNKGFGVYTAMLRDEQVKAVSEFKKHAVISRTWRFDVEETEDEAENERMSYMADFQYEVVNQIKDSWSDNLLGILSALDQGKSISEKNYKSFGWDNKQWWGIKDIKLRPVETFDGGIYCDQHGNIEKIEQLQAAKNIELPLDKIIYFVHQKNIDLHHGESDLRAAYRAYWAKDITIKLHNLYLERMAGGFIYAQYKGNLSPAEKTSLKSIINNVSGKMGAMLPEKIDLKIFNPVQTEAFEGAIAIHDKAIAKAVLVPNLLGLTEQGTTGSYAQSETHKEMFFFVINTIAKRLEEIINEQIFLQLAKWNFGTEKFPRFKFDDMSDDQKEIVAQKWADLVHKGAVTKSDSDEQHIRNLLNFPEKTEDVLPGEEEPNEIPPETPVIDDDKSGGIAPLSSDAKKTDHVENLWLKRVDFVALGNGLDKAENKFKTELADLMGQVKDSLEKQVKTIVGPRSLGNVKLNEFNAMSIPKKLEIGLKRVMRENLNSVVDFNLKEAKKELPQKFAEKLIGPGMDTTQIERYLKEKGDFFVTGVLEPDVLKQVLFLLQNGIKYDKSLSTMIADLKKDSKLVAMLPETDAAGRAVNVPARLENIVRTNTSDAMNLARTNLFNREEYKGFIQAFEYSAILDDRVSDVCESLNGRIRKDWGSYTPPNHYQCRSVLVPVTVIDEWDGKESNIPSSVKPQEGFA